VFQTEQGVEAELDFDGDETSKFRLLLISDEIAQELRELDI